MTEKKRKILFWIWKIAGIIIACGLPVWAICEKFPIWKEAEGTEKTIGAGLILISIVLVIVFRKTVFDFVKDKLDLKHAPPLVIWLVLLIVSYVILYIGNIMKDMTTVLWMGFLGSALGTVCTYISERYSEKKEGEKS